MVILFFGGTLPTSVEFALLTPLYPRKVFLRIAPPNVPFAGLRARWNEIPLAHKL